jgi:SAM-dependent methyltransferase
VRKLIQRIPWLVQLIIRLKKLIGLKKFVSSEDYWKERYKNNGNSGLGSYDHLAEFKAQIINDFIKEKKIASVIEFGCGDGNQLKYFVIPKYLGVDISEDAIKMCKGIFLNDSSKSFVTVYEFKHESQAELTLSLDVIYHLVEDEVYNKYMKQLFLSSLNYVIIYSSNEEKIYATDHVKGRKFTTWVENNFPEFDLINHIPNKFASGTRGNMVKSISDFYIYERKKG